MRRVVWADAAQDDYLRILRYITADDPDAAERVVRAIEKTGDSLADYATGRPGRVRGTYEKSITRLPYILAYTISEDDTILTIVHVIHTSRDWPPGNWPV